MRRLFVVFILFVLMTSANCINLSAQQLRDSTTQLHKLEYEINAGLGYASSYKDKIISGEKIIGRNYLKSFDYRFDISYFINPKWKLKSGFGYGYTKGFPVINTTIRYQGVDYRFNTKYKIQYFRRDHNKNNDIFYIPIQLSYNAIQLNVKNKIWIDLGIDILRFSDGIGSYSLGVVNLITDTMVDVITITTDNVPKKNFNIRFAGGINYYHTFSNYHQFILGIDFKYSPVSIFNLTYRINPDAEPKGFGTIINHLNTLSLNIGYSFNNEKKKQMGHKIVKKRSVEYSQKSDSIFFKNEFRFYLNTKQLSFFSLKDEESEIKLKNNPLTNNHAAGVGFDYSRYLNRKYGLRLGFSFGLSNTQLLMDSKDSKTGNLIVFDLYGFEFSVLELKTPLQFFYQKKLKYGDKLEFAGGISAKYVLFSNFGHNINILDENFAEYQFIKYNNSITHNIIPELNFDMNYLRTTYKKRTILAGIRINYGLSPIYKDEFEIIQSSLNYQKCKINYQPLIIELRFGMKFRNKMEKFNYYL